MRAPVIVKRERVVDNEAVCGVTSMMDESGEDGRSLFNLLPGIRWNGTRENGPMCQCS
jgi:hypothetical protein